MTAKDYGKMQMVGRVYITYGCQINKGNDRRNIQTLEVNKVYTINNHSCGCNCICLCNSGNFFRGGFNIFTGKRTSASLATMIQAIRSILITTQFQRLINAPTIIPSCANSATDQTCITFLLFSRMGLMDKGLSLQAARIAI